MLKMGIPPTKSNLFNFLTATGAKVLGYKQIPAELLGITSDQPAILITCMEAEFVAFFSMSLIFLFSI